ncbi:DUF2845 domain-containing protein [Anaeromyxobacter dehalogenans]|uniref:DUF2845 domain-containing protein n=1 Tax=Anaeromyxobacter dehalogenans (strain 2CP-C) TaxID=290397 RepID=Q2ILB7_ANADE|nr:DUF2845 domain-containing protein [Anaeromyxobacter dehalogenans]ABC82444.1 hypothetical protein Adeh_2674 [Anaeromyxobacter dehalogenans 2CP-C]
MHARSLALLLLALLAPSAHAGESSLRCDGGTVELGASRLDLLARCGEPALRDAREIERSVLVIAGRASQDSVVLVEQWTYNHGPQRFIDLVTVEGGRVVAIERGGYGYAPERVAAVRTPGRASCDPSAVRVGESKLDLLVRCGEPIAKDVAVEPRALPPGVQGGAPGEARVPVELWTFDFGPQRFTLVARLEAGKVVAVERGGYGTAP